MSNDVQTKACLQPRPVAMLCLGARTVALVVSVLVGVLLAACTTSDPLSLPAVAPTTMATGTPVEPGTVPNAFLPLVISTTAGTADVPGDLSGLEIYMEKTGCEGPCPVYWVTVQGDGSVLYNGKACVNVVGEQTDQIAQEAVRSLTAAFYQNDFFSLADSYVEDIQDIPATLIRFTLLDRSKQVVVQLYDPSQAPTPFQHVAEAIYDTANLQQWVTVIGTPAPCP